MYYYQLIFKSSFRERDFYEGQTYIFKSDLELEKGDYVVALTKFGYQIAVVYEKNEVEASYGIYGESVAKIVTKLEGNYYKEKEKAEELKTIEKILNKKAKEMSKVAQYEAIAKYDPTAKELLEKYINLKNDTVALPIASCEETRDYEDDNIPF